MVFKLTGTCTFNKAKVFKVIYIHVLGASGLYTLSHVIIITRSVCRFCFVGNVRRHSIKRPVSKMVVEIGNNDSVN